jgi:hypothetical protein
VGRDVWGDQGGLHFYPWGSGTVPRNLTGIYTWFGEVDVAVEQFDRYLSVPAVLSIESILLDPVMDPIGTIRASRRW